MTILRFFFIFVVLILSDMAKGLLVAGIGEALWDVFPDGAKLGGAPANFAYHVSRFGIPSVAVSALGEDELGNLAETELRKKLDISMERVPFPTGTVRVTLDGNGVPRYEISEGVAWDNIPLTESLLELASGCDAVCFGSLAQRNAVSRETILAFLDAMPSDAMRIFDINLRQHFYTKEIVETSLEKSNILKINDEELKEVGLMFDIDYLPDTEKCRRLRSYFNLSTLILTCGTDGSYVFADGVESFLPTPEVEVADTVGAGDSFSGAFCAGILKGLPIVKAHELAVRVSAFVCTKTGAMPEIPADIGNDLF